MTVSFIIPAFNAADTLPGTLESVIAQTEPSWEAIIIDDGSTDETATVAAEWAERDSRIRVIRQANGGVSSARNAGIESSSAEWLCFLDADDLLAPRHLEKLLQYAGKNPRFAGVYSGWARFVDPSRPVIEKRHQQEGDLFSALGRNCLFAIHSCLIRRSAVVDAGGFDTSLATCEDWDLWQRIARTGAEFGCIRDVLAFYRMSTGSLSSSAEQMLKDGLKVLQTIHSLDPRVKRPKLAYADGLNPSTLPAASFYFLGWCAGMMCGEGRNTVELFDILGDLKEPLLNCHEVAEFLFHSVPVGRKGTFEDWIVMPEEVKTAVVHFLETLEHQSGSEGLAKRAWAALEGLIAPLPGNFVIGKTFSCGVEVTSPIADVIPSAGCDRVCLKVTLGSEPLGHVHLPVFSTVVPSWVIKDSIAAQFCWPLLRGFFQRNLYPSLRIETTGGKTTAWRGSVLLAGDVPEAGGLAALHDAAGWTLYLQELWGLPEWKQPQFYASTTKLASEKRVSGLPGGRLVVHAGEPISEVSGLAGKTVVVELQAAGVGLGMVEVPLVNGAATAGAVLTAVNRAGGIELCRAVVRETLVGEDWSDGIPLGQRLHQKRQQINVPAGAGSGQMAVVEFPRRRPGTFGDSASRRAVLPSSVLDDLTKAAGAAGEPAPVAPPGGAASPVLRYNPGNLPQSYLPNHLNNGSRKGRGPMKPGAFEYNRAHFESLFSRGKDPWSYTSGYEQIKYEQTLDLLPGGEILDALELACAEGHFTCQLARRVQNLTAMDISTLALQEAAARCHGSTNVRFAQLDLLKDEIHGRYDVIICSEVLYYTGNEKNLAKLGRRIAAALKPGGTLIMAHAHLVVDDPDKAGYNWDLPFGARRIGEIVSGAGKLTPVREIRTPFYRVHSFRRPQGWLQALLGKRAAPKVEILEEQPAPLPQSVAAQALWNGGKPVRTGYEVQTSDLPILMFHRVAPDGVEATRRWRLTPEEFEERLRYLADCGCYTPQPEEWFKAASRRSPLPGRAVLLTFDDGFLDFYTEAAPLLKKYGFRAMVFAVSGAVGRTNHWDAKFGEELPLMTWDQLKELQEDGFIVGAHTATHPPLTTLSPEAAAAELASARAEISRNMGTDVLTIAYPYGDVDEVIAHLAGAVGHAFGFTCQGRRASYSDNFLLLPRIEVRGDRSFKEFVSSLGH